MAEQDRAGEASAGAPRSPDSVAHERDRAFENEVERATIRLRRLGRKLISLAWVPLVASLLSLTLSLTAIYVSTQQPDVSVVLPDQIRIAQGRSTGAGYAYFQPAFVHAGRNERVEVIRDMALEVSSPASSPATLRWTQQLRLVGGADSGGLRYEYVGDAVPLVISARSAAAPLALFEAPAGWHFAAGEYTFTLVVERVVVNEPIRIDFDVTVSADDIALLDQPGQELFVTLPLR